MLAEHYTLAEQWPEALRCQMQAARRAQSVYANEDAIHRYRTAIEVAAQVPGSTQQQLAAHEGLGDTYQLVGQYDESLASYAAARAILDTPDHAPDDGQRQRADLCRKTGRVYEYRGEYEAALDWVQRGLALVDGSEGIETARLRLGGAAVFQREGKWPAAIEWSHLSREIAERLDTHEARQAAAHADYLLGNGYRRLGETDQAGLYLQRSLDTYRAIEDQPGMARAYNNLATFYRYQDDWTQATDYYQQALSTLERIGELYGQAVIANNLAEVLLNRGQLDGARAQYRHSLDIAEELGISGLVALLHNNLGHAAVRAGDWAQALRELERSLEMFQKLGAEEFLPELYRHLARAHLDGGDPDRALGFARMSIERALASQTRLEEGCARRVLGSIYRAQGMLAQARTELERSLSILEDVDSPYQVARTGIELAVVCAAQGAPSQAGRLRREAIATFERLGAELDLSRAKEDRR